MISADFLTCYNCKSYVGALEFIGLHRSLHLWMTVTTSSFGNGHLHKLPTYDSIRCKSAMNQLINRPTSW